MGVEYILGLLHAGRGSELPNYGLGKGNLPQVMRAYTPARWRLWVVAIPETVRVYTVYLHSGPPNPNPNPHPN